MLLAGVPETGFFGLGFIIAKMIQRIVYELGSWKVSKQVLPGAALPRMDFQSCSTLSPIYEKELILSWLKIAYWTQDSFILKS